MIHRFGDFELDDDSFELRRGGQPVSLEPRGLDLLIHLFRSRGRLISYDELVREVWRGAAVSRSAIAFTVSNLRRALADQPGRLVETVRGRGYRFARDGGAERAAGLTPHFPLVGRDSELRELELALDGIGSGQRHTVLLRGEAGIGKTRLAEEHASRARARGVQVLVGRALEGQAAPDFWPWVQVVRGILALEIADAVSPELQHWAEDPTSRVTEPRRLEEQRFELFDSVARSLAKAAQRLPLLVVLEDLHAADEASLRLLNFLLRSGGEGRLMLLVTSRESAPCAPDQLGDTLAELVRSPRTRILELGRLRPADVTRLVEAACGSGVDPELARAIVERSEGNPLFATALLAYLGRVGRLDEPGAVERALRALPDGVRGAIASRVSLASPACRRFLEVASVLGHEFDAMRVAEIEELAAPLALADEAIGLRLLEPCGPAARCRFAHMLMRDSLYESMSLARRAELHLRATRAVSDPVERASHLDAAGAAAPAVDLVEAHVGVAEQALAALALETALAHFRAAANVIEERLPGEDERLCRVLVQLAFVEGELVGSAEARVTIARAVALARRIGSAELLALAILSDPGLGSPPVVPFDKVESLEEALRGLGPEHAALRSRVLTHLAALLEWSDARERRAAAMAEAEEIARRLNQPSVLWRVLNSRWGSLWISDRVHERRAVSEELLGLARVSHDTHQLLVSHEARATTCRELGESRTFRADLAAHDRILAALPESRFPLPRFWNAAVRASVAFEAGRLGEAESLAVGASQRWRIDAAIQREWLGALLYCIWREQGRLAQIAPIMENAEENGGPVLTWRAVRAGYLVESGREAEALCEFEAIASEKLAEVPRDAGWLPLLTMLADLCARFADRDRAPELLALFEPYRERFVVVGFGIVCVGSVARYLGKLFATLGLWDDAVRDFEHALAANTRIGSAPFVAHTQCELAEALRNRARARDRARVHSLLRRALATATDVGMPPLRARIEALTRTL